jgi:demethylmenaquinone methyltransferase/2-methoxy-6-polyprenyl-1,4-benzoquinol methylase
VRSYGAVAWCYDELCAVYSLDCIGAAKSAHLAELEPGARVLYAGVGRGQEAVEAARRGARVTAVDCSPAMLGRLRRRLHAEGLEAELLEGDFFEHVAPTGGYDVVVAHFVLDLFELSLMREALTHLCAQLGEGGRFVVADFAAPRGGRLSRALSRLNYRIVDLAAAATGLAALHPMHDYAAEVESLGHRVTRKEGFGILPGGVPLYESISSTSG